uniref:Uncharacterized protein n=1 Tax=Panagrolaimus sp. PS1159 TaxID=55785 RepID=A0AC35GRP4_9BILA
MIKIYRPINDTWVITTENFQKLFDLIVTPTGSYRMVRKRDITKFSTIFEDIHYGLRFGFSNLNDGFYLDFSFYAGRASANIQISFENTEITYIFEDHSTQKRTHSFPSFDEQKMFVNGKLEIKIKG